MTDSLFDVPRVPAGPVRRSVDDQVAAARARGAELPGDLVLIVQSLADRVDQANAGRIVRGFVLLTSEYRSARRDLFGDVDPEPVGGGGDGFAAALAEFTQAHRAEAGDPA